MLTMLPVFYLHYNKNAARQGDAKVWSIKTSKGCFHASRVVLEVPVETVVKSSGHQPRAFLKGHGYGQWIGDTFVIDKKIWA